MLTKIRAEMKLQQKDWVFLANHENNKAQLNVLYATGFKCSAGYVLIGLEDAYFLTDNRYELVAKATIKEYEIVITTKIIDTLQELVAKHQITQLYFDPVISFGEYEQFQALEVALLPFGKFLEDLRMVKTEVELEKMIQSAHIADLAFEHMMKEFKLGMTELDVANLLESKMFELGASSLSFESIVASGVRGSMPHGRASDKVIEDGDLVTCDFGCYYNDYASDMTRTFGVGKVDAKLIEIYNLVLEAQLAGVAVARAGVSCFDVDAACRKVITDAGYGEYFTHGTGHGLGLDVHEAPSVSKMSKHILSVGNTITVEPGIYIEGLGGVRIEDDLYILEDGNKILNNTSKQLQIIEV